MTKKVDLSIIIVNFNTEKFLIQSIESICSGVMPLVRFEIIIVDNHSYNNSVKEIEDFVKNKTQVNIRLIKNQQNLGFAKANNLGVKKALGKYILFLNPDTQVSKNVLNRMLLFMNDNEEIGVATCKVLLSNGVLDDACHRGFPTPWNAFCHFSGIAALFRTSLFFNGYHLGYRNLDKIHEIDSCAGAFMLVRRIAGDGVGWFDEDYFWYGEDLDFCYRIKEKGWQIMFVPDESIIHLKGIASGIKNHSQKIATATTEIQVKATQARFDVMKTFYQKHYQSRYPKWLTYIVMKVIEMKRFINLLKYKNADRN